MASLGVADLHLERRVGQRAERALGRVDGELGRGLPRRDRHQSARQCAAESGGRQIVGIRVDDRVVDRRRGRFLRCEIGREGDGRDAAGGFRNLGRRRRDADRRDGRRAGVIFGATVSVTCWLVLAADAMKLGSPVAMIVEFGVVGRDGIGDPRRLDQRSGFSDDAGGNIVERDRDRLGNCSW